MTKSSDRPTSRKGRNPGLGLAAYRLATRTIGPLVPFLLAQRMKRGKEDAARLDERQGISCLPRPSGPLIWIHAASVGESLSVLPLVKQLLAARDDLHVLVTTGTVTSAALMAERLPTRALHQFVPLDHPAFCRRFLAHWQPDVGVWVESEFWPNLILETDARAIPLALINARVTLKSYEGWRRFPDAIRALVSRFTVVFAQTHETARRLQSLGARHVETPGNLKHDAEPLTANPDEVKRLTDAIGARPVWLASNTHEGEEIAAAEVHAALSANHPRLLTLIVPRHPARGDEIAAELKARHFTVSQRSRGEAIAPKTDFYLADTLGEMGVFYRLCDIVFIGGTFPALGGHNPFEPAHLHSALIAGPSDFNFAEAYAEFTRNGALIRVDDVPGLTRAVSTLLSDDAEREQRARAAARVVATSSQATSTTAAALLALLPPVRQKDEVAHA
jgi:3-deoxy-D-manno-octulosonic-acid transferase